MTSDQRSLREYGGTFVSDYQQTRDRIWGETGTISAEAVDRRSNARDIVALCLLEQELRWMIEYIDDRDVETGDLSTDLETIEATNATILSELGDTYESILRDRFETVYESYPSIVVDVFEFEPVPLETTTDIDRRDELQYLFEELSLEQTEFAEGIRVLDSALKRKYRRNADLVDELDLADPYKPDHYWWRHPEQVFELS